jgi:ubiquinone/menaquinone biosynthesis C-methylase UbiE
MVKTVIRRWHDRRRHFASTWNTRPLDQYLNPDWHDFGSHQHSQHLLIEFLNRILGRLPGRYRVLDVPCGNARLYRGFERAALLPWIDYHGVDLTPKLLEASSRLAAAGTFVRASIEALPYASDTFDIVIVQHLFRHLESYERALRECLRVCRSLVVVVEKGISRKHDVREAYFSAEDQSWYWVNRFEPGGVKRCARAHGATLAFLLNDADVDDPDGQYVYVFFKGHRLTPHLPPATVR